MKKQGKETLIKWDKKSIIFLIAFSSVIILFFSVLSIDVKGLFIQNNENWNSSVGTILSIENVAIMEQTRTGNTTRTIQYKILCSYVVNQVEYKQEIIHPTNIATNRLLNWIKYPKNREVEILYQKDNPTNSYINTNINSDFYKNK
jgi:hypothetical protein